MALGRLIGVAVLTAGLTGCGGPSNADIVAKCPDIAAEVIDSNLGEVSGLNVTDTNEAAGSVEGSVTIDGQSGYWWFCGKGIAKTGKVEVDVRDPDNSQVLSEFADVS